MRRLPGPLALVAVVLAVCGALVAPLPAGAAEGQMTWAVHTSLVPTWCDPAESIQGTPFMVLSATHDALVKPMPGKAMGPRVEEAGLGLLGGYGFSAPYEDVKLKAR